MTQQELKDALAEHRAELKKDALSALLAYRGMAVQAEPRTGEQAVKLTLNDLLPSYLRES